MHDVAISFEVGGCRMKKKRRGMTEPGMIERSAYQIPFYENYARDGNLYPSPTLSLMGGSPVFIKLITIIYYQKIEKSPSKGDLGVSTKLGCSIVTHFGCFAEQLFSGFGIDSCGGSFSFG